MTVFMVPMQESAPNAKTVTKIVAAEDIEAGAAINLFDSSGTLMARNADASDSTKPADGFVTAKTLTGADCMVNFIGLNDGLTGLTMGAMYWLSTAAGEYTNTPPSGSGEIVQYLGKALSSTVLMFTARDATVNP